METKLEDAYVELTAHLLNEVKNNKKDSDGLYYLFESINTSVLFIMASVLEYNQDLTNNNEINHMLLSSLIAYIGIKSINN